MTLKKSSQRFIGQQNKGLNFVYYWLLFICTVLQFNQWLNAIQQHASPHFCKNGER